MCSLWLENYANCKPRPHLNQKHHNSTFTVCVFFKMLIITISIQVKMKIKVIAKPLVCCSVPPWHHWRDWLSVPLNHHTHWSVFNTTELLCTLQPSKNSGHEGDSHAARLALVLTWFKVLSLSHKDIFKFWNNTQNLLGFSIEAVSSKALWDKIYH